MWRVLSVSDMKASCGKFRSSVHPCNEVAVKFLCRLRPRRAGGRSAWLHFHGLTPVFPLDVVVEDDLELFDDVVALEGGEELAVDVDGRFRFLEGAGEGDADVGMLGLAGAIDDATHDRELQLLDAG